MNKKYLLALSILVGVFALFFIACDNGNSATSSDAIVDSVSISAASANVELGGTLTFTATVTGTDLSSSQKKVTWSIAGVDGTPAAGTKISSAGILTIDDYEMLLQLKVIATSSVDKTKSAEYIITVYDPGMAPSITDVSLDPATLTLQKGGTQQIVANIDASSLSGEIYTLTWSIVEPTAPGTTIESNGMRSAILTIDPDETLTTLTVKAVVDQDIAKIATSTVTIDETE